METSSFVRTMALCLGHGLPALSRIGLFLAAWLPLPLGALSTGEVDFAFPEAGIREPVRLTPSSAVRVTLRSRVPTKALTVTYDDGIIGGGTATSVAPITVAGAPATDLTLPLLQNTPGLHCISILARDASGTLVGETNQNLLFWEPVGQTNLDSTPGFFTSMESFAVDEIFPHLEEDLKLMAASGVQMVRVPFHWYRIQPSAGTFEWSRHDAIVNACRSNQIRCVALLHGTPAWAMDPMKRSQAPASVRDTAIAPASPALFTNFVAACVRRYGNRVGLWELWNEPDSSDFWYGSFDEYQALLSQSYAQIKALQPGGTVISGGVADTANAFTRQIIASAYPYFDAYGFHSHGTLEGLRTALSNTQRDWQSNAVKRPLWLNETGFATEPALNKEWNKARTFFQKATLARHGGVSNYTFFIHRHLAASTVSALDNYAALDGQGCARPVLLAYNTAVKFLRGAKPLRRLNLNAGLEGFLFARGGERIAVAWALSGAPSNQVAFLSHGQPLTATLALGNELPLQRSGSLQGLSVGEMPVLFASPDLSLTEAAGAVSFDRGAPEVRADFPDLTTNRAFTVRLSVNEPNGWFSTNGGAFEPFGTNGIALPVEKTTSLLFYGRGLFGNTGATNARRYDFDTQAPVLADLPPSTVTNRAFSFTLRVNEPTLYYSLNGGAFAAMGGTNGTFTINESTVFACYTRDRLGNAGATLVRQYLVDRTAPTTTLNTRDLVTNTPFTLSLSLDEESGYVSFNDGPFHLFHVGGTNITLRSTTLLRFFGRDSLGNTSPTNEGRFVFDTRAPLVTGAPASQTTNQPVSFTLLADEADGFFSTNGSPFQRIGTLGTALRIEAPTTLSYFGRDALGNTSATNTRVYQVDTRPPRVVATPPSLRFSAPFSAHLEVDEEAARVSIDNGPFHIFHTAGTNLWITRSTTLRFFGRDAQSNTSATNEVTYTFDATAPTLSGLLPDFATNRAFSLSLSVDEDFGYVSTDGSTWGRFDRLGTNLPVDRETTVLCYARDEAGNQGPTLARHYVVDQTPPHILGAPESRFSLRPFSIALQADERGGYVSTQGSNYGEFGIEGTNLLIDRTTTLLFFGRDAQGNTSETNARQYTVDLVAHWALEETTGTSALDASPYGHTLLLDGPDFASNGTATPCGRGLSVESRGGTVRAPSSAILDSVGSNQADFAVSFLMCLQTGWNGKYRSILRKTSGPSERTFGIWMKPSNNCVHYRISTTSNFNEGGDTGVELPVSNWVHLVYQKSGSNLQFYLNAAKVASVALRGEVVPNHGDIYFGTTPWSAGADCLLDEVRIYKRTLSTNEIAELCREGLTPPPLPPQTTSVHAASASVSTQGQTLEIRYDLSNNAPPALASAGLGTAAPRMVPAAFMQFEYTLHGLDNWRPLPENFILNPLRRAPGIGHLNTLFLRGFPVSGSYDIRVGGRCGGDPIVAAVLSNLAITVPSAALALPSRERARVFRQPVRSGEEIIFLGLPAACTLHIRSIDGTTRYSLPPKFGAADGSYRWDGRGANGRAILPGAYLCETTGCPNPEAFILVVSP